MSSPGMLLAWGRWNDVYDLGDGRVLRRFRDPTRSAEFEAEVMRHARAHGVRVPEVFSAQGTDLVMGLAKGPTMLSELTRHPAGLARNAATLVTLGWKISMPVARRWAAGTRVGSCAVNGPSGRDLSA